MTMEQAAQMWMASAPGWGMQLSMNVMERHDPRFMPEPAQVPVEERFEDVLTAFDVEEQENTSYLIERDCDELTAKEVQENQEMLFYPKHIHSISMTLHQKHEYHQLLDYLEN